MTDEGVLPQHNNFKFLKLNQSVGEAEGSRFKPWGRQIMEGVLIVGGGDTHRALPQYS